MRKVSLFLILLVCVFTGSLFSQNNDVTVIDAKNGSIDGVVRDLVLDRNILHTKSISIQNVSYGDFGVRSDAVSFAGANSWFDDPETYVFLETQTMRSHNFKFWFQPLPSDREGRRYMMELNGNLYNAPQRLNINGKFFMIPLSGTVVLAFLVESFEIRGRKYEGLLPATVLDPTDSFNWGRRIF